jgi:putative heme-binding domain-containing protein
MPRFLFAACLLFVIPLVGGRVTLRAQDFPLVVNDDPLSPEEQQKKFRLPPGFEIQLVAAEPDVQKPINLNFDHAGRLYFSQSVEYPFAARSDAKPRDTVRVIDGIAPNGRFAKVRTAVDGLNIPIGVLPLHDRLLVFSIPNIYACRDEDGDGVYEKREVLYGPFDQRDTHGLNNAFTRALDGWIYACHGFANDSHVKGRDGHKVHMNSGNVYRFRADGSRIEKFTHGQVNPFGLCFDPLGNLYSADCHTLPAYMLLRGAYYPSFGKPHDGLGFGPEIMRHSHGSTGIAGIVYYAAEHFPPEYRDTLFIGNPITHRVNHDKLKWHGSTPEAIEQPDFLTCDDPWFRPVDLKLGPDGALYIADFYNCIIGHYEVPLDHPKRDRQRGRIWRVVYKGTTDKPVETPTVPDLTKLDLDMLIEKLGDRNLVVRTMTTHQLVDRFGKQAANRLAQLLKDGKLSELQSSHALWILPHGDSSNANTLLDHDSALVRVHAARRTGGIADDIVFVPVATDRLIAGEVLRKLADQDPFVRRAAAQSLAGVNFPEAVEALFKLWEATPAEDIQLIHTIRMALRDIFAKDVQALRTAAQNRAGEIDQTKLAEISLGIPSSVSAGFVLKHLETSTPRNPRFDEFVGHVARHLNAERLPELFKLLEKLRDAPTMRQRRVLAVVHQALQARGAETPSRVVEWANTVAQKLLGSEREREVVQGASLARELKLVAVLEELQNLARTDRFPQVRAVAIDACVACDPAASIPLLANLAASAHEAVPLRQKAAQALGSINSDAAHRQLLALLPAAPARLAGDLAAGLAGEPAAAESLIAAIESGKVSALVLRNPQVSIRLGGLKDHKLRIRIESLSRDLPPEDERVKQLMQSRLAGFSRGRSDATAGKQVFTKSCGVCHKIDGEGSKIGPDLDGIGNRGVERLVEDILDPSRNVDQAFRTTLLTTDDGRSLNGLALREEGNVLVLADNQGKEVRVPTDSIEERKVSPLSPMPANVAEQLSEQDFYHLLAFLLAHDRQGDKETGRQGENPRRR